MASLIKGVLDFRCGCAMAIDDKYSKLPADLQAMARLFDTATDQNHLANQVDILRSMLLRAIQEIESLKKVVLRSAIIDDQSYKQLHIQTILRDKGGPGPSPWRNYSFAPYIASEEEYLRSMGLNDQEIAQFKQDVANRQNLT